MNDKGSSNNKQWALANSYLFVNYAQWNEHLLDKTVIFLEICYFITFIGIWYQTDIVIYVFSSTKLVFRVILNRIMKFDFCFFHGSYNKYKMIQKRRYFLRVLFREILGFYKFIPFQFLITCLKSKSPSSKPSQSE